MSFLISPRNETVKPTHLIVIPVFELFSFAVLSFVSFSNNIVMNVYRFVEYLIVK